MPQQNKYCLNCGYQLEPDHKFCANCGQKSEEQLTISVLFYNTIANYFSFDARFLKSFFPLIFKPGYLPAKFLEGKRLLYLHPAQMYLFISVIFFFIFSFSVRQQVQSVNKAVKSATYLGEQIESGKYDSLPATEVSKTLKEKNVPLAIPEEDLYELDSILNANKNAKNKASIGDFTNINERKIDSMLKLNKSDAEIYAFMGMKPDDGFIKKRMYRQALKFFKNRDGGTILQTFYDSIPIVLFFLLPLFALILKLLYFNRGRYAHHLVFSFYYFSFVFAIFSIYTFLNLNWNVWGWVNSLLIWSLFIYLLFAMKRFYGQGKFLTFFKFGVLSFSFLTFVTPITAVFLIIYSLMFF